MKAGEVLFDKGTFVAPPVVGALAAAGIGSAVVHRKPIISLVTTGDELVEPGESLEPGQIYESNRSAIGAALRGLGFDVREALAGDDRESLGKALESALESDIVITTGGVSVGDYDLVCPLMSALGVTELFWGVAMKPAKPTFVGTSGEKVVFGLPGNPVSAMVAFTLFVRPYLRTTQGLEFDLPIVEAELEVPIEKVAGREEFVPGCLRGRSVTPNLGRASHKTTCLALADVLIRVPTPSTRLEAGTAVSCVRLDWSLA